MKAVFRYIGIAVLVLVCVGSARAQLAFSVSVNTAPLMSSANGPFSLDFQLNDGAGTGDANNIATISNFVFGGGSATGTPTASGGASGDLGGTVALTDSSFLNELYQGFTPGNTLSFDVNLTTNLDSGGTPDEFSFAILDGSLNEIPTDGFGALVLVDLTAVSPPVSTFTPQGSYAPMGTPAITVAAAATPEPGPLALLLGSAVAALPFTALRLLRRRPRPL